jgi:hypothetical protein
LDSALDLPIIQPPLKYQYLSLYTAIVSRILRLLTI